MKANLVILLLFLMGCQSNKQSGHDQTVLLKDSSYSPTDTSKYDTIKVAYINEEAGIIREYKLRSKDGKDTIIVLDTIRDGMLWELK